MIYEVVYCTEVVRVRVEADTEEEAKIKANDTPEARQMFDTRDSSDMLMVDVMEVP